MRPSLFKYTITLTNKGSSVLLYAAQRRRSWVKEDSTWQSARLLLHVAPVAVDDQVPANWPTHVDAL